ncbi:hypothetical protein [Arthrobacter sp. NPDC092385]|uniref:hypothetical protein n=1 Tax=Arthrobacter sp. NPDC092385 TaxID=3363943 RepID=UPI003817A3B0
MGTTPNTTSDAGMGRVEALWDKTPRQRAMAMHPSASGRKLDVLVSADTDLNRVRVVVHGRLSQANLHGLELVVRRAAALSPDVNVVLDLSGAQVSDSLRAELHDGSIGATLLSTLAPFVRSRLRVIPPLTE